MRRPSCQPCLLAEGWSCWRGLASPIFQLGTTCAHTTSSATPCTCFATRAPPQQAQRTPAPQHPTNRRHSQHHHPNNSQGKNRGSLRGKPNRPKGKTQATQRENKRERVHLKFSPWVGSNTSVFPLLRLSFPLGTPLLKSFPLGSATFSPYIALHRHSSPSFGS